MQGCRPARWVPGTEQAALALALAHSPQKASDERVQVQVWVRMRVLEQGQGQEQGQEQELIPRTLRVIGLEWHRTCGRMTQSHLSH